MTAVAVTYHKEADGWWAESADVDGFVAAGADLPEVRRLVREGLPFYLDDAELEIFEQRDEHTPVVVVMLSDETSTQWSSGWSWSPISASARTAPHAIYSSPAVVIQTHVSGATASCA